MYDTLASREQFIAAEGITAWPDGTVTARYGFRHALYPQVLYEQIGQARRVRLHLQLGAWKEVAYGNRAAEIAGELAVHFSQGRDDRRAALYHRQAAESSLHRSVYREAMDHCREGLALLARMPDTPEYQRQELALRMILAAAVSATQGFVAAELVQNLSRARVLCQALHDDATLVSVLVGLGRYYDLLTDGAAIEQHTDEELRLLDRVQEPILALQLHTHLGTSYLLRGALGPAQAHHARVLELYDPQWHQELVLRFSLDPAVLAGAIAGCSLWLAGWPDRACARLRQGLNLARELGHPYSLCMALVCAARLSLWCGALEEAERLIEEGMNLAHVHGIVALRVQGSMHLGCIRVQRGEPEAGLSLLTEGIPPVSWHGSAVCAALAALLCGGRLPAVGPR